jgi:glutathione S-transferase
MGGEQIGAVRDAADGETASGRIDDATLYVFPGSHACRTAMLMLEHKRIAYRRVDLLAGLHPVGVRMRGFPGSPRPIRSVDGATNRSLALLDRIGTVPALRAGGEKVQTNRAIARFLERACPEPPLFPLDPARRAAVEEAERWGDEVLQMAARRIVLAAAMRGLDTFPGRGARGRLGPLMSHNATHRMLVSRVAAQLTFRATPAREQALLEGLPAMLDAVDAWIAAGVLNGEQLNAADLMIAPSLALLTYRRELRPEVEGRPAGALLERVLPEPEPVAA